MKITVQTVGDMYAGVLRKTGSYNANDAKESTQIMLNFVFLKLEQCEKILGRENTQRKNKEERKKTTHWHLVVGETTGLLGQMSIHDNFSL